MLGALLETANRLMSGYGSDIAPKDLRPVIETPDRIPDRWLWAYGHLLSILFRSQLFARLMLGGTMVVHRSNGCNGYFVAVPWLPCSGFLHCKALENMTLTELPKANSLASMEIGNLRKSKIAQLAIEESVLSLVLSSLALFFSSEESLRLRGYS